MTTILLTGVGAPGTWGTIEALRNNPDDAPVRIIGTDCDKMAAGRVLCDGFEVVPDARLEMYAYVQTHSRLRDEHPDIDLTLSQTTAEKHALTMAFAAGEPAGSRLDRVIDKYALYEATETCYVPRPLTTLIDDQTDLEPKLLALGYPEKPVIVKPATGSGSRGIGLVQAAYGDLGFPTRKAGLPIFDRMSFYRMWRGNGIPPYLLQQYLPGLEYSVDCFQGSGGFIAIPRIRQRARTGIATHTKTIIHTEKGRQLAEWCEILGELFDLRCCWNAQFKESAKGTPKLLEINPRIAGTMIASVHTGFNMVWASVREALGRPVEVPMASGLKDIQYVRHWSGSVVR